MNTINKRKEYFTKYILNNDSPLDDDVIKTFYDICSENAESDHKYFFPFFKTTYKYYENRLADNLQVFSKWFSFFNYKDLDYKKNNQNYTDLDMYIIMSLKIGLFLLNAVYIDELLKYYTDMAVKTSFESDYFIKYNACKFYYECNNVDKARTIYFDIITYKREWYIEMIPFKYHDYSIVNQVIINILHANNINHFDFNIIVKYLKNCKIDTSSVKYIDNDPKSEQLGDLKSIVINYVFDEKVNLKLGKLTGISKSNAGFIKDETGSYYINPKDMLNQFKVNQMYYFSTYESFDTKKKQKAINALIIKEAN